MPVTISNETPEARELSLVGKVELRIALADSDAKLESTLKTYLPPLLLKLASDFVSVRNKVNFSISNNNSLFHTNLFRQLFHLINFRITLGFRVGLIGSKT